MLYFRCKEAIYVLNILQSRCFREHVRVCVIALVNIAPPLWNISPLKCLSVLVLLAGVEAVRCTLCSTREIQEAPGHIITWYFTIYDTWRKMPRMIAKCGPSRKLYPERDKCLSWKFAFGTGPRDAAAALTKGLLLKAREFKKRGHNILFSQCPLWARRQSSRDFNLVNTLRLLITVSPCEPASVWS